MRRACRAFGGGLALVHFFDGGFALQKYEIAAVRALSACDLLIDLRLEESVNLLTVRSLTWATVVAALLSAILLAGEDAALPDLVAPAFTSR